MISIKDKIAKMITVANGGVVRRCHSREAGIFIADEQMNSHLKKKKRPSQISN